MLASKEFDVFIELSIRPAFGKRNDIIAPAVIQGYIGGKKENSVNSRSYIIQSVTGREK